MKSLLEELFGKNIIEEKDDKDELEDEDELDDFEYEGEDNPVEEICGNCEYMCEIDYGADRRCGWGRRTRQIGVLDTCEHWKNAYD